MGDFERLDGKGCGGGSDGGDAGTVGDFERSAVVVVVVVVVVVAVVVVGVGVVVGAEFCWEKGASLVMSLAPPLILAILSLERSFCL